MDDPIGTSWGYTSDMRVFGAGAILTKLIDTVSKNGVYMLNLSPKADGTFPEAQQNTLLDIGHWLSLNGEAIYDTHNWVKFSETDGRGKDGFNLRFTVKDQNLYAILIGRWPAGQVNIASLATGSGVAGNVTSVTLVANGETLPFTQDAGGLKVSLPSLAPCRYAYALKITGLKMNPSTVTASGNPE